MPFTFAHPAAVLPFRKYCSRWLNLPALIVGSMTPDLGYFLHNWVWALSGHSFSGSVSFDLPAGFILLALFYMNARPVSRLLPYPHREALASICPEPGFLSLRSLLVVAFSIILGALTHIFWDGFTHANGWCVRRFSSCTPALFSIGDYPVTIWHVLQHSSTIIGILLLADVYIKYIKSQRFFRQKSILNDLSCRILLLLIFSLPVLIAFQQNVDMLRDGIDLHHLDDFLFKAIVSFVCLFVPLLCVSGLVLSLLENFVESRRGRESSKAPLLLTPAAKLEVVRPLDAAQLAPPELSVIPVDAISKQSAVDQSTVV